MATRVDGRVLWCRSDTTTQPPMRVARVEFPGPPLEEVTFTAVHEEHYEIFLRACGTSLKVDVVSDPQNNVTQTTVHA